jgi:hypothetical protein
VGESKEEPGLAGAFFMKMLVPPLLRDEYADKEAQERVSSSRSVSFLRWG